jgi:hypothetical protein
LLLLPLLVLQVIIAFNKRFWPERLYDVVCTHSFVPEFWMTQHAVIDEANKHLHAVVGECTASIEPEWFLLDCVHAVLVH